MCRLPGSPKWLEIFGSFSRRDGVRNMDERLRRLPDRNRRNDLVLESINRRHLIAVLEADVEASPISRWPEPMRQFTDRNIGYRLEIVGAKNQDLVQSANSYIRKPAMR